MVEVGLGVCVGRDVVFCDGVASMDVLEVQGTPI